MVKNLALLLFLITISDIKLFCEQKYILFIKMHYLFRR